MSSIVYTEGKWRTGIAIAAISAIFLIYMNQFLWTNVWKTMIFIELALLFLIGIGIADTQLQAKAILEKTK